MAKNQNNHLSFDVCINEKRRFSRILLILCFVFIFIGWIKGSGQCQGWTDLEIRLLPDESFAVIEEDMYENKIRHCPHHDLNGKLDEEQLIYLIGTFEQEEWLDLKNKEAAKKHLLMHYERFYKQAKKNALQEPVDINRSPLTELVTLPYVGPVLAVKIVEYRNAHNLFETIEGIKNVEGVGSGIFNAIKFYISAD